jgi:hypothetical protein
MPSSRRPGPQNLQPPYDLKRLCVVHPPAVPALGTPLPRSPSASGRQQRRPSGHHCPARPQPQAVVPIGPRRRAT